MIEEVKQYVPIPLVHIVNLRFATGKLPKCLRTSITTASYKSKDSTELENYKPIS